MKCDKCNKETSITKQITSKKTGKPYLVYVCQHGCMNGKFAYSFFAPKENGNGSGNGKKENGNAVVVLMDIADTLKRIERILSNPNSIHIAETELQPDEETPF